MEKTFWEKHHLKIIIVALLVYFVAVTVVYINYHPYSANKQLTEDARNIEIETDLNYKTGTVYGTVYLTNLGRDIYDLNGKYPIHLGVSLVDGNGKVTEQDYQHLEITSDELKEKETISVEVQMTDLDDLYEEDGSLRFAIMQEGAGWNSDYTEVSLSKLGK
ncbi:MAG: hypothetical protein K6E64_10355 [Lachnospiraceae bacterium]|nr:hypothetical protein [Lachnospiraceae bacterium]